MEKAAQMLNVEQDQLAEFAEFYETLQEKAQSSRYGQAEISDMMELQRWKTVMGEARAICTVRAHMAAHAQRIDQTIMGLVDTNATGQPQQAQASKLQQVVEQRMIFAGVYGTSFTLDELLTQILAETEQHAARRKSSAASSGIQKEFKEGKYDHRHARIKEAAYPYSPACSSSHGAEVLDCFVADPPTLAGYIHLHGNYIDDISVDPTFHGCGVAKALIKQAAARLDVAGFEDITLDVRACNLPAFEMYKHLGFQVKTKKYPCFYDWHGGYRLEAKLSDVAES